jgi:hypothetical protein
MEETAEPKLTGPVLMSLATLIYGTVPPLVDLGRNPCQPRVRDTDGRRIGDMCFWGLYASAATTSLYGGALGDKGGVPPVMGVVDANLLGFSVAAVLLLAGWILARETRA